MTSLNVQLTSLWQDYAAVSLLVGGLLGVVLLLGGAVWAKRSRRPLRPIALAVSMNLALLLNAEGMWVIATEQLHLPRVFAVLVFAVFEICFLTSTSLAAEQYRRTTVYRPDGTIETPGHPGPMLWIAALIAAVSGIIVASNAATGTEKLLRLAVPTVIFLMWWAALTAAGQRVRRGRFAYSPRRLAERWGALIPDDDPDLTRMAAERQVRRMVTSYRRLATGSAFAWWWRSRLERDARSVTNPVVEDVAEQLIRIDRVMRMLTPGDVEVKQPEPAPETAPTGIPAPVAASRKVRRMFQRRALRTVKVAHLRPTVVAAQAPDPDPRSKQEIERAIRFMKDASPELSQRDIAHLARASLAKVNRALKDRQNPEPPPQINGKRPDLEGARN